MAATDHAIVVGINLYPHLPKLNGPVADATEFHEWLVSPTGGAVPSRQAHLLLSPDPQPHDPVPSKDQIEKQVSALIRAWEEDDHSERRRLWFYFAGHGLAPEPGDAALLMADHVPRAFTAHMSTSACIKALVRMGIFQEIVVIADCCRELSFEIDSYFPPWPRIGAAAPGVRHFAAYAADWTQVARERDIANGGVRGIFTYALLEGLRSGLSDTSKLEAFVKKRVIDLCEKGHHQTPDMHGHNLELIDMPPTQACRLVIRFTTDDPTVHVEVLNDENLLIERFPMAGGTREVEVEPALHSITRSDNGKRVYAQVEGAQTDVTI